MTEVLSGVAVEMRVAQFEIYLNARRQPELQDTVLACLARFEAAAARMLEAAGVPYPERWAKAVLALGDGFAVHRVAGAGAAPEEFERALRALVTWRSWMTRSSRRRTPGAMHCRHREVHEHLSV